jgi:acyl carrier protein
VREIVAEHLGVPPGKVTAQARFIGDLGADSLDTVELIMAFEEAFNVSIPETVAERIHTVGDAESVIEGCKPRALVKGFDECEVLPPPGSY